MSRGDRVCDRSAVAPVPEIQFAIFGDIRFVQRLTVDTRFALWVHLDAITLNGNHPFDVGITGGMSDSWKPSHKRDVRDRALQGARWWRQRKESRNKGGWGMEDNDFSPPRLALAKRELLHEQTIMYL